MSVLTKHTVRTIRVAMTVNVELGALVMASK